MTKEKVLDLANKISRTKRGSKHEVKPEDPEYRILEPVVTDEMAEIALSLELRQPKTKEEVAAILGKQVEEVEKILFQLADDGVISFFSEDDIDYFQLELWVPGVMEFMVVNKENVKKYPQIAECFEEYSRSKGEFLAGNVPPGLGVMRVIPIESAIDGETRRASYEEVSMYLNDNDTFSVSDCACRAVREAMGEGCGHLKEDICIQLGDAAEFYIRTGRGREITREKAFEIIKKAEDNGLMHQIANTEGPGKTHAICNCCGCACLALRHANHFKNPDIVRSNYVSQVDKDKCVACGECVENCPSNALKLGQKICEPSIVEKRELPYNTEWGPDKWNPNYRLNREVVVDSGSSPCKADCPAHIGIQGYIKLASQGRYTEALELIKQENPFPAVCGRVCPRYCESACTRGDIDDPIAIDDIKKFIAEQDLNKDRRYIPEIKHQYDKKIAVIGAGPSGLSCAYYLAIEGYQVTVFEKQQALGGMLTFGIPSFRLEKNVVQAEIDIVKDLGVKFMTGVEVGKDVSLQELRNQGFKAFYLAIGAQAGRRIGIEGEDAEGVMTGVDFLREVNAKQQMKLAGRVAVIGGGNVAIDVARTAARVGASQVDMYCLEKWGELPAMMEEIDEALLEGIRINTSWGPKRILVDHGRVTGIEFKKCISVFDENNKFDPQFDENQTKIVAVNNILISVGQAIDWGHLIADSNIQLHPNKTIKADPVTYQTGEEDVFAGGDALTGPKFAIDAIAMGKEGAISIHRFVQPGQSLLLGRTKRDYRAFDIDGLDLKGYDHIPRQTVDHVDVAESKKTFRDLRSTFTEDQVKKETERCLGCGATVVDEFLCVGCGSCVTKCKFDAISMVRKYDATSVELHEIKPTIKKYMVKRKVKVATNKVPKTLKAIFSKENS
ncbi:FAD-dependent oxidoreductase [Bacillus sp. SM2101]|uniref:FAD-dependent oxidoreductase n=1 Tax=Bacillaceae TaxID=186817 RepID=UPI001BDE4416|nr:FAD-dependent oxidoreductase [Bacillus sp. SM2101]